MGALPLSTGWTEFEFPPSAPIFIALQHRVRPRKRYKTRRVHQRHASFLWPAPSLKCHVHPHPNSRPIPNFQRSEQHYFVFNSTMTVFFNAREGTLYQDRTRRDCLTRKGITMQDTFTPSVGSVVLKLHEGSFILMIGAYQPQLRD